MIHHCYLRANAWILSLKTLCIPHVGFLPSGKAIFLILNFLCTSSILISFSFNCLLKKVIFGCIGSSLVGVGFFSLSLSLSSVVRGGLLFIVVCGLLIAVASLVAALQL